MTPQTRALIEAAENHISYCRCGGTGLYSYVPDSIAATDCADCAELRAAISSAKAAEEDVETNYVVEVRCPKKNGPNWDSEFDSLMDAQKYKDKTNNAYYVCSIVAIETRRFEVREKEGL